MESPRVIRLLVPLVVTTLLLAACDSEGATLATTTTVADATGGTARVTTTTTRSAVSTTPSVAIGSSVDSYQVVVREPGEAGEILYIVIPQAAYTDVDLENFIGDLLESGTATWGVEIFDDITALEAYQKDEAIRTEEEQDLIDQHHFVSLVNGDTIRYRGPFETSGELVIGS